MGLRLSQELEKRLGVVSWGGIRIRRLSDVWIHIIWLTFIFFSIGIPHQENVVNPPDAFNLVWNGKGNFTITIEARFEWL